MKLECIQFWATNGDDAGARDRLPAHFRQELIEGAWGIQIDASKTQVIQDLEKHLRIGERDDYVKYSYVEVDKSEIPNYSHFFIRPQEFDWQTDVFFEVTPRTCGMCPWGVKIVSPIQLHSSSLQGIGGVGGCPLLHTKLLFVTREVREHFESESITGLEYDAFEDLDGSADPGYVARVTHGAYQTGSKIIAKPCKHNSIGGCYVFDLQVPRHGLRNDVQMIDRVTVKGTDYAYHYPFVVVSQRLLSLLFAHSVPELEEITILMKQKQQFHPLIVS